MSRSSAASIVGAWINTTSTSIIDPLFFVKLCFHADAPKLRWTLLSWGQPKTSNCQIQNNIIIIFRVNKKNIKHDEEKIANLLFQRQPL